MQHIKSANFFKREEIKHVCSILQQFRDFWDDIWSQFPSCGLLKKKKKSPITFYFSVLRNVQKHQQEQLSSKPQNAVQSSSFWLHNMEEIKAIKHFWALGLKSSFASFFSTCKVSGIITIQCLQAWKLISSEKAPKPSIIYFL